MASDVYSTTIVCRDRVIPLRIHTVRYYGNKHANIHSGLTNNYQYTSFLSFWNIRFRILSNHVIEIEMIEL